MSSEDILHKLHIVLQEVIMLQIEIVSRYEYEILKLESSSPSSSLLDK